MGRGIMTAVPLTFEQDDWNWRNKNYFTTGFFDNYSIETVNGNERYVIKNDILIKNYKSFLLEFYDLIEVDFEEETKIAPDKIPTVDGFDEFMETFSRGNRGVRVPFIDKTAYMFSVLGCDCTSYWLFYTGSYKAYFEEYTSLLHFEKILAKAMSNPLSNAVKFGMFG